MVKWLNDGANVGDKFQLEYFIVEGLKKSCQNSKCNYYTVLYQYILL